MLKRGFTLIEVLVTLVILMFGLLGIAGLMAKGQRASFEAFQRQQALSLANEMVERMQVNRVQSTAYAAGAPVLTPLGLGVNYNDLMISAITNCGAGNCSGAQLATYDLAMWDGLLTGYTEKQTAGGASITSIVNPRGCIEETANTLAACPAAPAPIDTAYTRTNRVSVSWQGNEDTAAPTSSTCGTGLYGADTKRRVVSLDIILQIPCP